MTGRKHVITMLVLSLTFVVAATTAGTALALPADNGGMDYFFTQWDYFTDINDFDENTGYSTPGGPETSVWYTEDYDGTAGADWVDISTGSIWDSSTTGNLTNGAQGLKLDAAGDKVTSGGSEGTAWPSTGMTVAGGFMWASKAWVGGDGDILSFKHSPADSDGSFDLQISATGQSVAGIGEIGTAASYDNTADIEGGDEDIWQVNYTPGEGYWVWRNYELLTNTGPILDSALPIQAGENEMTFSMAAGTSGEIDWIAFENASYLPDHSYGRFGYPAGTECSGLAECSGASVEPSTEFAWGSTGLGDWHGPLNWSPGMDAPPNSAEHTATFGGAISGPSTVVVDTPVTVNRIVFDNGTHRYAVAGTATVNLVEGLLEEVPRIEVVAGDHEFQADVNLLNNTTVDVASGAVLTFDNSLTLGGNSLTKIGDGTLAINNNLVSTGGTINCQVGTCSGSGTIGGDLNNSGGAVSPGNSAGALTIDGDYTQGSGGTLAIEIAGTSPGDEHDRLVVNGQANLAGALAVTLLDSFTPLDGHTFDILDFNSVSGDFDSLNLPDGFDWNWDVNTGVLSVGSVVGGLAGDFNGDGTVDAADYTIYMDNFGGDSAVLGGNGSGGSTVGQADYLLWKNSFGNTRVSGSSAAIPEPAALLLALLALVAAPLRVR